MLKTKRFIFIGIAIIASTAFSSILSAGQKRHHDNGQDNPSHNYSGQYDDRYYNDRSKQHKRKMRVVFVKVIGVIPIYKRVRVALPRRVCRVDHSTAPITRKVHTKSAANAVVGGIIGGVVGHQLGSGRNKDAATIAGTLLGAAIGYDNAYRTVYTGEYRTEYNERCNSQTEYRYEDRLEGYRVTYLYHGEILHTQVQRHPGDRLRIEVPSPLY